MSQTMQYGILCVYFTVSMKWFLFPIKECSLGLALFCIWSFLKQWWSLFHCTRNKVKISRFQIYLCWLHAFHGMWLNGLQICNKLIKITVVHWWKWELVSNPKILRISLFMLFSAGWEHILVEASWFTKQRSKGMWWHPSCSSRAGSYHMCQATAICNALWCNYQWSKAGNDLKFWSDSHNLQVGLLLFVSGFIQLSEPFRVFEFDFWKRPEGHAENELHIKATDSGRVHAVVSW